MPSSHDTRRPRQASDPTLRALRTFGREFTLDTWVLLRGNDQRLASPWRYPPEFEPRRFTGRDGNAIAGMVALHDHPAPCLVLTHGLLMTMHFRSLIRLATKVFREWGWHVATWDQRGCGRSAHMCDELTTGGWAEGRDLLEIARELRTDPRVERVSVLGISLGVATVLHAACAASDAGDSPIDRVVSVSAPVDMEAAIRHISTRPPLTDSFLPLWLLFRMGVRRNVRRIGAQISSPAFSALLEEHIAPLQGDSTAAEYAARADLREPMAACTVPVLALHAQDDFCVPVTHAEALRRATRDRPNVRVVIRDRGSHAAFAASDPQWYDATLRDWFGVPPPHAMRSIP